MSAETAAEKARRVVREADNNRALAAAAESARVKIRLGQSPVLKRGLFGFRKQHDADRETAFTEGETKAIYIALRAVRDQYTAEADHLDATLRTEAAS